MTMRYYKLPKENSGKGRIRSFLAGTVLGMALLSPALLDQVTSTPVSPEPTHQITKAQENAIAEYHLALILQGEAYEPSLRPPPPKPDMPSFAK